jgi:hypothetical protein
MIQGSFKPIGAMGYLDGGVDLYRNYFFKDINWTNTSNEPLTLHISSQSKAKHSGGWGWMWTKSCTYGMFLWASTSLALSAYGHNRMLYIRRVPASSGGIVEPVIRELMIIIWNIL